MPLLPIPDRVFKSLCEITPDWLRRSGITLLLADLDNTLARYGQSDPAAEVLVWREDLRRAGVTLFLLSNSRKPTRVNHYAKALEMPFLGHAGKPGTKGYRVAMARLGRTEEETAMVGDQIFTDIWGAKRAGVLALLVEPMELKGNPGRYLRYAAETPFRLAGKRRNQ